MIDRSCATSLDIVTDQPTILLIKIKLGFKMDRYDAKIKLCRNPMLEELGMYEFKMALFQYGEP